MRGFSGIILLLGWAIEPQRHRGTERGFTGIVLLLGCACWLGMGGSGCGVDPNALLALRPDPAIIAAIPIEDTRTWRFEVDLRRYPETHRINWSFGDGSMLTGLDVASGRSVTHEFARDGTFEVSVFLFSAPDVLLGDPARMIGMSMLPVDVLGANVAPIASFVVEDVLDEEGQSQPLAKRFVAAGSGDPDGLIVDYRWEFGDGTLGQDRTVEHTFPISGRFAVRLTVTDDRGATATAMLNVLVNSPPTASFTFEVDPDNALRFTFDASASSDPDGAIQQFTWDFGDESGDESGIVVAHTYAVPDDYTVKLTVVDELGATVSTTRLLDVTGSEPFVREVIPRFGDVDTIEDVTIDGENFESGATVRLVRGAATIAASSVTVVEATTLEASFDLSGAALGDYDVIVENPDTASATLEDGYRVVTPNTVRLVTDFGDIVMELLVEDAPITTDNFIQYIEDGFYDGTIFHRVVPNFVVQGGGFLPGFIQPEGLRDPIPNEFDPANSNIRGTVAMAKLGGDPDSATSQFFVNLSDNSANLDNQNGGFTVFAVVVEGMNVVDMIAAVELDGETPVDDVILIRAERE